jgi:hypothetical protein
MSVGRLAGSGTEAHGSGARRARTGRATAGRATAEDTTAERTAARGAAAESAVARPSADGCTTDERTADGRTADERTADERTADERTADGRTADGRTADGPSAAGHTAAGHTAAGHTAAGHTAAGHTADGHTADGHTAAGHTADEDASAQGAAAPRRAWGALADPAPNVIVVSSQTGSDLHQRAPASSAAPGMDSQAAAADGLFARYTRDYVTARDGQQVTILQAGCTTADDDLGVGGLREAGGDIVVSLIDDDQPVTSAALGADESLRDCVQGDLRTVSLPPRTHDIVLCALLLQRTQHAELVLDRLVATIRPGGLLLLQFGDRDSAAGFLDRVLPSVARRAIWRRRRPGQPGPYPAVYERLSSARGVQAYALMRELVIAERQALGGLAGTLAGAPGFLAAQKLVAWLSRGRLTAAHEELLYVLRKPEDRFARIL